jgi:TPR repeat protein
MSRLDSVAPRFPRVYRVTLGWRIFIFILCGILGVGALAGLWYIAMSPQPVSLSGRFLLLSICAAFVVLVLYTTLDMLASRLTLRDDEIEFTHLFVRRALRKSMIAGRRLRSNRNAPATLTLVSRDPSIKPLKIPQMLQSDAVLQQWLQCIPDLDAMDRAEVAALQRKSEAEIVANPVTGATDTGRAAKLARTRLIARVLYGSMVPLLIWCLVYPRPYTLVVGLIAALPWMAVLLTAMPGSLFRMVTPRGDAHPNLLPLLMISGLPVLLRAVQDVTLIGWLPVLMPATVLAGGLVLGAAVSDRALMHSPKVLLSLLPFALAYGVGATVLGNALLDRSPSQAYRVSVLAAHMSRGKHPEPYLTLAPWGPQLTNTDIRVSTLLYELIRPGQFVCVQLHPGAVQVPWVTASQCAAEQMATAHVVDLRLRADAGDAGAQNDLAMALYEGIGVPPDAKEAAYWFKRAVAQGNTNAAYHLGEFYRTGVGVPVDMARAAQLFRDSASVETRSAVTLGYMLETGQGVPVDQAQARSWYEKAALLGDVTAAENLATMYTFGRGGPVDYAAAFRWNKQAGDKGGLRGMNGVGYAYLEGLGMPRDLSKAVLWLRAAAEAGQPNAMMSLGLVLTREPDGGAALSEGYKWLALAARTFPSDDPHLPAVRRDVQDIAPVLEEQERHRIDQLVATWRPSAPRPPME